MVDIWTKGRIQREFHQVAGNQDRLREVISYPCRRGTALPRSWVQSRLGRDMHQGRHGHWEWADLFRQRRQRALGGRSWAGREAGVSDGRHVEYGGVVWLGV